MSQKGFASIILILIILILTSIGGSYYYFVYLPQITASNYLKLSPPIIKQLDQTIDDLDQEFQSSKNIKLDYKDAKSALNDHLLKYQTIKSKSDQLKLEYKKLPTTQPIRQLDFMINQQFDLVDNVLDYYSKDLSYRQNVFAAFGETFPDSLEEFKRLFYTGSERTDYILATQKISDLAQQTLYDLDNIQIPPDEKEDHTYRRKYVVDIKDTFKLLNEYYRASEDEKALEEINQLSSRTEAGQKEFETIVQNYVTKSSTAQGIEKYKSQTKKIQDQFNNLNSI